MQEIEKPDVIPVEAVRLVHQATGKGVQTAVNILEEASPLYYSRLVQAARIHVEEKADRHLFDPIECDPELKDIVQRAGAEAEEQLKDHDKQMGYCHLYWRTKQRILKEKYGIEWFTPDAMNPHVIYD